MRKIRKILLLPILSLLFASCGENKISPTSLKAASQEVKMILHSERDLNDIVTLRFEPKYTTNKKVNWSTEEKNIFSLDGSMIKANEIGKGVVKATSEENPQLSVDVTIEVYDPNQSSYFVSFRESPLYSLEGLKEEYEVGEIVNFQIKLANTNTQITKVKANDDVLSPLHDAIYQFVMPEENVNLSIQVDEKIVATQVSFLLDSLELQVGEETTLEAQVEPKNTTEVASWSVLSGNDCVSLIANNDKATIKAVQKGTAKIQVKYNASVSAICSISIQDSSDVTIENIPSIIDMDVSSSYTLLPSLSVGEGSFTFESQDESILKVSSLGELIPQAYGSTQVIIQVNEFENVKKEIQIEVTSHGTKDHPLTIEESLLLANKICLNQEDTLFFPIYAKGKAKNHASSTGDFTLSDFNKNQEILVYHASYQDSESTVMQNDEVLLYGYLKNYKGTMEFAKKDDLEPKVMSLTKGTSTITIGAHEHLSILISGVPIENSLEAINGESISLQVVAETGYSLDKVMLNGQEIHASNGVYSFIVKGNATLTFEVIDASMQYISLAKYHIAYDLGTRVTAKKIDSIEELFKTFILDSEGENLITSISQMDLIYGGAHGGRSATAWHIGNVIKFGTTSVNGSLTFSLSQEVCRIQITGYVSDNACKIQVGDSESTDWATEEKDNKTTIITCSNMNETTKEIVETNETTTLTIDFMSTQSLKIATLNQKPLYITAIEFWTRASIGA